jgi:hypothetical protein
VFKGGKVEILFKLSYEQAESLARLMQGTTWKPRFAHPNRWT